MLAPGDGADGGHDVGGGAVFENVAFGPHIERFVEEIFFAVDGQEDDGGVEFLFAQRARDSEAVHLRHVDVEDGDLGLERLNPLQRRLAVAGFGDDFELRVGLDHLPQSLAHNRMIVGNQHADVSLHGRPFSKLIVNVIVVPCPGREVIW